MLKQIKEDLITKLYKRVILIKWQSRDSFLRNKN